jgi:hypothetical protein
MPIIQICAALLSGDNLGKADHIGGSGSSAATRR